jgi:hypothetical protein
MTVEGIKIAMTTEKLLSHLQKRIDYHKTKSAFYKEQVEKLREGGVKENMGVSNDPTRSLLNSAEEHTGRADLFSVLAEHLIPNETYILGDHDLTRLELISRHF